MFHLPMLSECLRRHRNHQGMCCLRVLQRVLKKLSVEIEAPFLFLHVCLGSDMAGAGDINDSLLYFRKFHGYSSLKEYYEKESCLQYLHRVSSCSRLLLHWKENTLWFLWLVLPGVFRNNQAQYIGVGFQILLRLTLGLNSLSL